MDKGNFLVSQTKKNYDRQMKKNTVHRLPISCNDRRTINLFTVNLHKELTIKWKTEFAEHKALGHELEVEERNFNLMMNHRSHLGMES